MKKLLVSSALALALSSSAVLAEESGAFVGLDVGTTGIINEAAASVAGASVKEKSSGSGLNFGLVAGYKQFFTESFGLRYYANVGYLNSKVKDTEAGVTESLNAINYGVNVDALYNFVSSESMDMGAFLGLGLGANTWSGKYVDSMKTAFGKTSNTSFDVALNVGLRSVFAKQHGIELAARVPFMPTKLVSAEDPNTAGLKIENTLSRNYSVGLRYTFSF